MLLKDKHIERLIWDAYPEPVQKVIEFYAKVTSMSPQDVIEYAIACFVGIDRKPSDIDKLLIEEGEISAFSPYIQKGIHSHAAEIEYPPEAVLEMAIASFLDPDAVTFDDCFPGIDRDKVSQLKRFYGILETPVA